MNTEKSLATIIKKNFMLLDIEPPTIRDCPESFTVRLSPGQSARAVTWVEPHFSDNVRVATIKKSREPGTIMTAGEHVINYETSDSSNNRAKCTFTVKVLRGNLEIK